VLDSPEMMKAQADDNFEKTTKYVAKCREELVEAWMNHAAAKGLTACPLFWILPNPGNDGYATYEGVQPTQDDLPPYARDINLTVQIHLPGTVKRNVKAP
jgi:hypothetical protein